MTYSPIADKTNKFRNQMSSREQIELDIVQGIVNSYGFLKLKHNLIEKLDKK